MKVHTSHKIVGNVTWVDIDQSMGKKLAMHIITYPPGIPVYLKGKE